MTLNRCSNPGCGKAITGKNFGYLENSAAGPRAFVDACSMGCRALLRSAKTPPRAAPRARVQSAAGGVTRSTRPLSRSQIKRKMRPTESQVSTAIAAKLDAAGLWNTRTQSGAIKTATGHVMKLCRKGTPDRILAAGLHVWIEVKREGEKASTEQLQIIEHLRKNGALAFVLDNVDDLSFILDGLERYAGLIDEIKLRVWVIQTDIDDAIQKRNKKTDVAVSKRKGR